MLFDDGNAARETIRLLEQKGEAGLWTWNLKTREMIWSRGVFELLGLEPGSITPSHDNLEALVHPEDVRPPGELELVLSKAGAMRRDFRIIQLSGRVRWLSSRGEVLLDRQGIPARAIGALFDVSKQQEALAHAEALQTRLSVVVTALDAVTWSATPRGHIGDTQGWCKMTGQTLQEAAGAGWLNALHPDDRSGVEASWQKAIASKEPYKKEYRLRNGEGHYRWVRSRAIPLCNQNNAVREWVGLTQDIHVDRVWSAPADKTDYVTGAQLRAARAILHWSVRDLAQYAVVSTSTIRLIEEFDGAPRSAEPALRPIRAMLERHGVEFLFPPVGHPCVRQVSRQFPEQRRRA